MVLNGINWSSNSYQLPCGDDVIAQQNPSAQLHYNDVIMGAIVSQITSLTIVFSTVYSDVDQRKHQNSASLAFVGVVHRGPVNSPHKWAVTRKMLPFDDVIMEYVWCVPGGDVGIATKCENMFLENYSSHYVNHLVANINSVGYCVC